jgi:hypothetical protein
VQKLTYVAHRAVIEGDPPLGNATVRGLRVMVPPHATATQPTVVGAAIWTTASYGAVPLALSGMAMPTEKYLPRAYSGVYCENVKPVAESSTTTESAALPGHCYMLVSFDVEGEMGQYGGKWTSQIQRSLHT